MKLKELTLNNFCQHSHLKVVFGKGLNGITAHNGAGKSNLIRAILYAITGTLPDKLQDYIKSDSLPSEDSYVTLTFESAIGKSYTITRWLRPRKIVFKTPETEIKNISEANAYLSDILGIDFDVVKNILLVSQEEFISFLTYTPTDRLSMLYRVFNLSFLQRARDSLLKLLSSTEEPQDVTSGIQVLQESIKDIEVSYAASSIGLKDESIVKEKLKQLDSKLKALQDEKTTRTSMHFYCNAKESSERSILQCRQQIQVLEQSISNTLCDLDYDSINVEMSSLIQEYETVVMMLTALYFSYTDINDLYHQASSLIKECGYTGPELRSFISDTKAHMEIESNAIRSLESDTSSLCPTCGSALTEEHRKALLEEHVAKLNELQNSLDRVSPYVRKWTDLEKELASDRCSRYAYIDCYQKLQEAQEKLRNVQATIFKQLPSVYPESMTSNWHTEFLTIPSVVIHSEAIPEYVTEYRLYTDSMYLPAASVRGDDSYGSWPSYAKENLTILSQIQARFYSEVKAFKEQKAANEQASDKIVKLKLKIEIDTDNINQCNLQLEKMGVNRSLQEIQDDIRLVAEEFSSCQTDLQRSFYVKSLLDQKLSLESKIQSLKSAETLYESVSNRRKELKDACELLSNQKLPRAAMLGMLQCLVEKTNSFLSDFGVPFTFSCNESADLLCVFDDGSIRSASRLSGGQKVLLAVAWRLALHAAFASEESCGFLALDEPTMFLDSDNIDNLTDVLSKVKRSAEDQGVQILVITHEESLECLFDNLIKL